MRVIGYIPLMYGAEYLEASIKSMSPYVEELHIIYTSKPSQGHASNVPCPESETKLKSIALKASDKIVWHNSTFGFEGQHRDYILKFSKGFDLVLTLDADEILEPKDIESALEVAYKGDKRHYGINGFINFWRSFNHVCLDGFKPYRIVNLNNKEGLGEVNLRIYHFSTAQDISIVRFKWNVSGHKNELRYKWIDNIYLKWTPENNLQDLHPVALGLWNAIPFDKELLPDVLKSHPNYNKESI